MINELASNQKFVLKINAIININIKSKYV